ncbi:hypothetical protein CDL12_13626 [Handroanthus impetiginosus]|uniref:Putative plant transposon protein domain-containing protein n=1 Tax=Handroanthus impetiginosus TaxID=429701 RepID=A0A2G9H8X5_9LAMI|nr:hypothetical protein CDL12_13626 [Handroanthus impetiginosus]
MGPTHTSPTKPGLASTSKTPTKTLFQDNPSIQESSESEYLEANSNIGDESTPPNLQHDDNAKMRHDTVPPSPVLNHGNTPPSSPIHTLGNTSPSSPSSITDWKKLNRGRGILFSSFPESVVVDWIRALHWDKFIVVNEVCYPHLVKLFYSNLVIISDDSDNVCLESFVLGNEFTLTTAYVNSLFNLPDEGSKFFGRAYPFSGGKALNNMSVDHFFLHKLIFCTLLSGTTTSAGHTTDINTVSMYLTYMVVHGRPVNLGFIILKYIAYSALHTSKNLPYGMLLTLVFKKEHVSLPPSWMEPPKERYTIDLNNLKKMRIHYFETDGYFSTDAPPRKCTRGSTSAILPPGPDILSIQDFFASLHAKIDSQSSTILELTTQLKELCRKLCKKSPS